LSFVNSYIKMKAPRLDALRVILSNRTSATQADLLRELADAGFSVSQPTLSHDLRSLGAAKIRTREGFQYILPQRDTYQRTVAPEVLPEYLRNSGLAEVKKSGNLLVLHTRPGYARGLAADIDISHMPSVAGTIAGYDTIFVARLDGKTEQELIDDLAELLPALKSIHL